MGNIVAPYAAVLALLYVALSVRVLLRRRRLGIGVGDGGDAVLVKALRAHGNFAEYVPLALLLIYLLETVGGAMAMAHVYGGLLVFGRAMHAWGVGQVEEDYRFRVTGMACTFIVLIGTATRLLLHGLGV